MEDFVYNILCFCDEFCEMVGDCCIDFEDVKEFCGLGNGECLVDVFFIYVLLCYFEMFYFIKILRFYFSYV